MSISRTPTIASARATAQELLQPGLLRESLRIARVDAALGGALRVGIAAGLAIVLPALTGFRELSAFAALGALTSLYGRYDTYRRRASLLTLVGVVMVGAIAAFSLAAALGAPAVVTFVMMAVLASGMTALVLLLRMGPPGATIVVFGAGAGIAGSPVLADVLSRTLAATGGALLAWVVCMAGVLVHPTSPARLAVRRAAEAVRAALQAGDPPARAAARQAIAAARAALADDASWRRTRPTALVLAENVRLLAAALEVGPGHDAGTAGTTPDPSKPVGAPSAAAALPPRRTLRAEVRAGLPDPAWRLATVRVLAGGLVAAGVAAALGLGHASWAVMGSTAVLQGATARRMAVRALQRAAGTVVGALAVAYPLLAAHLGFWTTAALVVVLQVATEVVVGRHYGLAQVLIAPMALLMTALGAPADPGALALDRTLDTAVGAAAGLVAVLFIHHARGTRGAGTDATTGG